MSLEDKIRNAVAAVAAMTPAEKRMMLDDQRKSFIRAEAGLGRMQMRRRYLLLARLATLRKFTG